jgi:hypothetical protein
MTGLPGTSGGTVPSTTSPATSATSPSTTTDPDSSGEDVGTCGFICETTTGLPPVECNLFDQDCPDGEKCMPWANDGGNNWTAAKCTPIADNPAGPGEVCQAVGSGVSGIDNCDGTSMCFNVDPVTLEGTCYAFCVGDESNAVCPDACDLCTLSGNSVLTICLPTCDPLAQDCDEGSACYLYNESFACVPDVSGKDGAPGRECEFTNACDEGTWCAPGDRVPDCTGAGCCSPFCTVGDDTPCAILPGTVCVPLFEEGHDPEGCVPVNAGSCLTPA